MASTEDPGDLEFVVARETQDDGVVVSVRGDVDVATAPALRAELHQAIGADGSRVIIDVSGMDFIDSAGLGVLVGALKRAREADVVLVLRGVQSSPRKVLSITGLDEIFEIDDGA
jgi:anti-sigma B factor antagonist